MLDDVFEVDVELEAETDAGPVDDPVQMVSDAVPIAGVVERIDPGDLFSVCVLTVPDLGRFPIPPQFELDKQPVDLSCLESMSAAETKALISPALPDEQLQAILAAERTRDKTRNIVLKAVAAELEIRGDGFRQWVERMAANPLTCRIAALAYQCGESETVVFVPCDGGDSEEAAIRNLYESWRCWVNSTGREYLGAWDLIGVMRAITTRGVRCGVLTDGRGFGSYYGVRSPSLAWIGLAEQAGGLRVLADSLGVAPDYIPPIPSPLDVFREWRAAPGSVKLQDWVAGQLMVEREILDMSAALWV